MAEFPAMPLWTDAYIGDTTHLTCEEHGAYLLLLMTAWRSTPCRLPDDDQFLARVTRCTMQRWCKIRAHVEPFFSVSNGFWSQKRLTKERKFLDSIRDKRRAAAHAKHRKDKETAVAYAHASAPEPTPIEDSVPSYVETQITVPLTSGTATPPEPAKAALWREMKAQIGGAKPGSMAGKWIKQHGDAAVFAAHFAAMSNMPADYVEWMTKRLEANGKPYTTRSHRSGKSYNDLHREMQEAEDDEQRAETVHRSVGETSVLPPRREEFDARGYGGPGPHLRAIAGGLQPSGRDLRDGGAEHGQGRYEGLLARSALSDVLVS